jgi:hypothetical protein
LPGHSVGFLMIGYVFIWDTMWQCLDIPMEGCSLFCVFAILMRLHNIDIYICVRLQGMSYEPLYTNKFLSCTAVRLPTDLEVALLLDVGMKLVVCDLYMCFLCTSYMLCIIYIYIYI